MQKVIISNEKKEEICKDYIDKMNYKDIMTKHGITTTRLYDVLKENGILKRHSVINNEQLKKYMQMVYKHGSLAEASKKEGFKYTTVYELFKRRGIIIVNKPVIYWRGMLIEKEGDNNGNRC